MTQILDASGLPISKKALKGVEKPKDRRMRVMWSSNHFMANSGYAQQMAYLLPSLQKDGWIQGSINFYGQEGYIHEYDGVKHYPRIQSVWGEDAMVEHGRDFNADITITQQDIWTLNPSIFEHVRRFIPWLPVDHDPIPPSILERAKLAYRILAYSKFAQQQLANNGLHSTYMPLMVDTKVFKPYQKADIRKDLGIPVDAFVFGMVAANKDNPPRKSFQEVLDAFKVFHDKHPESVIYFHTAVDNPGGFPIRDYAKYLGLAGSIYHPPPYDLAFKIQKEAMAKIYSTFDILLAPSRSEGFGVPIIEAQSCGVPVIVNNFTSMPELVQEGQTGEICEVLYKSFSPLMSYVGVPNAGSIYEKMEKLYKADLPKMGMLARLNAKQYDTEFVIQNHWIPFLETVQNEVYNSTIDNL
jgi:glycosyltransferase involved in cell wall biosynthesis